MKRLSLILLIGLFKITTYTQEKEKETKIDSTAVTSVDKIVKSLYNVISGEAG